MILYVDSFTEINGFMMASPKLLILDLDETLIHATEKPIENLDIDFRVGHYVVYKRPSVDAFLAFVLEHFDVAVWTSSNELYARKVVNTIFSDPDMLKFVWSRNRCTPKFNPESFETENTKNLQKVKRLGYKLEQVLMIDDTPEKLAKHYGNLIRMIPFEGAQEDVELEKLQRYLLDLKDVTNVRKIEKRGWQRKY